MATIDIYNGAIEVGVDRVWIGADTWERANFAQERGSEVIDLLGGEITVLLEDPAKRLEVITWLRSNGYTVEPA